MTTLALILGVVWGTAPRLLAGILTESLPTICADVAKALLLLYVIPSLVIWVISAPFLKGDRLVVSITIGVLSPFIGLLLVKSFLMVSTLFGLQGDMSTLGLDAHTFAATFLFTKVALAIPVGTTAGILMHRLVNGLPIRIPSPAQPSSDQNDSQVS